MTAIGDAEDTAVGLVVAATRGALTTFASDIEALYATQLTEMQAVVTSTKTQNEQLTSALAAATAVDAADQAKVAALTEQLATSNEQLTASQAQVAKVQAAFDAYVKSHPDSAAARFPGDPGDGRYDGCSIQGGDMSGVEAAAGAVVGVSRQYFVDTTSAATIKATLQRDTGPGRYPVYSTKVPNGDWSAVASGSQDAWLTARLDAIASVGKSMTLVLNHEPENDVNGTTKTAATFKAMYAHVYGIVAASYPMIALAPVYMGGKYNPNVAGGAQLNFTDWALARGSQCHYILFDEYNQSSGPNTSEKNWLSPADLHGNMVSLIQAWDPEMAWGVAEFGCRVDPNQAGRAAQWWTDFYALMDQLGAVLTSAFDSAQNSPNGTWAVSLPPASDERWPVFKAAIQASAHPTS